MQLFQILGFSFLKKSLLGFECLIVQVNDSYNVFSSGDSSLSSLYSSRVSLSCFFSSLAFGLYKWVSTLVNGKGIIVDNVNSLKMRIALISLLFPDLSFSLSLSIYIYIYRFFLDNVNYCDQT